MSLEEVATKPIVESHEGAAFSFGRYAATALTWALMNVGLGAVAFLLDFFVTKSPSSSTADIISTGQRLLWFMGGLLLLTVIIVSVGGLIRRRDRRVILLRERLADIYLSALRKSSLNPQLESPHHD